LIGVRVFGGPVLPLTVKLHGLQAAEEAHAVADVSWLDGCDGFAVYDQNGRVGTVAQACLPRPPSRYEPATLRVRTGVFHRRVVLIAVTAIEHVHGRQGRITLKARWSDAHIVLVPAMWSRPAAEPALP
jgi:hypothetical protein